jgi:hypothetical protein
MVSILAITVAPLLWRQQRAPYRFSVARKIVHAVQACTLVLDGIELDRAGLWSSSFIPASRRGIGVGLAYVRCSEALTMTAQRVWRLPRECGEQC